MHVAPHRNRPRQPTLAKTFDSLVALTMEKGFQPIFASKTHFQNPKVPPGLPGPSTRVPRPESFLRLRCRRKGGQYAVRCSVVAHLMLTPGPLGCVQPAFEFV